MFGHLSTCVQQPHGFVSSNGTIDRELRCIFYKCYRFDSVNSNFSVYFLKLIHINLKLSDPKYKSILKVLYSTRLSDFFLLYGSQTIMSSCLN